MLVTAGLATLLLQACGGGDGEPPAPARTATALGLPKAQDGSQSTVFPIPEDWLPYFEVGTNYKLIFQERYGVPEVQVLPRGNLPPGPRAPSANTGCIVTHLAQGEMAGTGGCGPCIGIIVTSPPDADGKRRVWVFHLVGLADPAEELQKHDFPPGSHIVVFGGDGTDSCSMPVLKNLYQYLDQPLYRDGSGQYAPAMIQLRHDLIVDGLYNTPTLLVDCNGKYWAPETALGRCARDGSLPLPAPEGGDGPPSGTRSNPGSSR